MEICVFIRKLLSETFFSTQEECGEISLHSSSCQCLLFLSFYTQNCIWLWHFNNTQYEIPQNPSSVTWVVPCRQMNRHKKVNSHFSQLFCEHLKSIWAHSGCLNPSAWGHLNPSSYCDVGRLFCGVFKLRSKLCRSLFKIM